MRGAPRQRGVVKVDKVEFEGASVDIKLNKNYGQFEAWVFGDKMVNKNVDELKREVKEKLKSHQLDLDWKPVIELRLSHDDRRYSYRDEDEYDVEVDRYYMFTRPNGEVLYRDCREDVEDLSISIGEPSSPKHSRGTGIIIPYTPAIWNGCAQVKKLADRNAGERVLFERLNGLEGKKLAKALADMCNYDLALVKLPKKAKRPGRSKK